MEDTENWLIEGRAGGSELNRWFYYRSVMRKKEVVDKLRILSKVISSDVCKEILSFAFEK
jgi:lysine/ornithine N-monooxygenase